MKEGRRGGVGATGGAARLSAQLVGKLQAEARKARGMKRCVPVCAYTWMCVHVGMLVYMWVCVCTCMCVCTWLCVCVHVCVGQGGGEIPSRGNQMSSCSEVRALCQEQQKLDVQGGERRRDDETAASPPHAHWTCQSAHSFLHPTAAAGALGR